MLATSLAVAQWLERPTGVLKVMGSIPVGNSDFFFVPRSRHAEYSIFSYVYSSFQKRTGRVKTFFSKLAVSKGNYCLVEEGPNPREGVHIRQRIWTGGSKSASGYGPGCPNPRGVRSNESDRTYESQREFTRFGGTLVEFCH